MIDSEVVAVQGAGDDVRILPFQALSTRARTRVEDAGAHVRVMLVPFDLMYLDGASLLQLPFRERRRLLQSRFVPARGELEFPEARDTNSLDSVSEFFPRAAAIGEGIMVKALDADSQYEPNRRVDRWLKVKKVGSALRLSLAPLAFPSLRAGNSRRLARLAGLRGRPRRG